MRGADAARLHLFGVRHHGPGSAHSLLAALDALDPSIVLIEGPPDADSIMHFAALPAMVPPVALLIYGQDDPTRASFYPFGIFSPEWQAMRWAIARDRPVRFIDLPATNRLALRGEEADEPADEESDEAPPEEPPDDTTPILRDPLGYLATLAGYDDGETWWNALIEQGANAPTIFAAIETAMSALRDRVDLAATPDRQIEEQREAHMRLAIGTALGETEGSVAVVCGAWHVPALRRPVAAAVDRALLKGLPKLKVAATWIPWTHTRLAAASGYGAGIVSPGWYAYLWHELERAEAFSPRRFAARWQANVAALLRANGRPASTASVIDAVRLAESLAALRDLALPGLDEMREASLATLCQGEAAPWQLIETELVIGGTVGEIADDVPQMPLQADLVRQQRTLKLKPEALDRDVSLDLRSEAGLAKSLLLHRLTLIKVPWGRMMQVGASRGTFRENWRLRWDPEFSIRLAEALIYGTTVEQAAGNAAIAAARTANSVTEIADSVKGCLLAGLDEAARMTIRLLQEAAAATSDVAALADAIPPLVTVLRYGTARELPAAELRLLVTSLTEAVCAGLVHACRNLQNDEATALRTSFAALEQHLPLLDDDHLSEDWRTALRRLADDREAHATPRGFAVRALHDQGAIDPAVTGAYLSRALSPAVPPTEAGDWLDGFLGREGQVLLYDPGLTGLIDVWLGGLGEDDFTALLPILRRAFASIDKAERRRLLDTLRTPVPIGTALPHRLPDALQPGFAAALPLLLTILGIDESEVAP